MKSYYLAATLLASSMSLFAQNTIESADTPPSHSLAPIPTDFKFSYENFKRDDGRL